MKHLRRIVGLTALTLILTVAVLSISNGCIVVNASSPATGVTNGTYNATTKTATIDRVYGCTQQMLDSWLSTLPGPVERIVLTRNCYDPFIAPITFNVPVTIDWGFNLHNYSEQKSVTFNRGVTVNNGAGLGTKYMTIRGGLQLNGGGVNLQYANVSGSITVNGGTVTALYSTINGNVTVNSGAFTLKISTLNGDIHENGGTVTATNVNSLGSSYHVATCTINGSVYRNAGNLMLTRNHVAAPVIVTGNIVIGTGTGTVTVGYGSNLDSSITLNGKLTAKGDIPAASGSQLNFGIIGGDIDISLPLDSSHIYTQYWGFADSRSVKISAYVSQGIRLQGTAAGDVSIKYAPIKIVGDYKVQGNFTTQHYSVGKPYPSYPGGYSTLAVGYASSSSNVIVIGSLSCNKKVTCTFDTADNSLIFGAFGINKATEVSFTAPGDKASNLVVLGLPAQQPTKLSVSGINLSVGSRLSYTRADYSSYSLCCQTYTGYTNSYIQVVPAIKISNLTLNDSALNVCLNVDSAGSSPEGNLLGAWQSAYPGTHRIGSSSTGRSRISRMEVSGDITMKNSVFRAEFSPTTTSPRVYTGLTIYGSFTTPANSNTTWNNCTINALSTFNGRVTLNNSAADVTTINAPSELNNCTFTNKILTSSPAITFNAPATISTCTVSSGGMLFNSGATDSLIDRGNYSGTVACNGQHFVTVKRGTFTDGGTKATSTFIPHVDSEANVNNNVTTVKLSNPPVVIDWGEFPGINLDLDLAAPTISVRRNRLYYTRYQENTWRAQTRKSRTKAKAPELP